MSRGVPGMHWNPVDTAYHPPDNAQKKKSTKRPKQQQGSKQRLNISIQIPEGCVPGQEVEFKVPGTGQKFKMPIPFGHMPGDILTVRVVVDQQNVHNNVMPGINNPVHSGNKILQKTHNSSYSAKEIKRHHGVSYTRSKEVGIPPPIYTSPTASRPTPTATRPAPAPKTTGPLVLAPLNKPAPEATKPGSKPKPATATSPAAGGCTANGEWACSACTLLNPSTNFKCMMCGKKRPAEPSRGPSPKSPRDKKTAAPDTPAVARVGSAAGDMQATPVIATKVELPQTVNCLANCGFYGSMEKRRLCNKCYDALQAQSTRSFSNDEAVRYLLDLVNMASLKEVKFDMAYKQRFSDLLQSAVAATHIKGVTRWETSIRPLTQFDKFPKKGTSACTFIAGVAALKQILLNQVESWVWIPSAEEWAKCISAGVAAFHAGMTSHPHLTRVKSSKEILQDQSGLGVNSDQNRNMTEAVTFVLKQMEINNEQQIESIQNMEEVFVALHVDNEDERNIASAMCKYPIGQKGLCQCLGDIFKRQSMGKGQGIVVTRSPETWCLCLDCGSGKLYLRDSHRKAQHDFESLDIFLEWILKEQSYFVPMSGCGIEHNLVSITSWKPSSRAQPVSALASTASISKTSANGSTLPTQSSAPPLPSGGSPVPPPRMAPFPSDGSPVPPPRMTPFPSDGSPVPPPRMIPIPSGGSPVPPPRMIVAPPRSSSIERRYDGDQLLNQLQFVSKYRVQGVTKGVTK